MKTLEMTIVLVGLLVAMFGQPSIASADAESEAENGANSMMLFLTSVPALILSAFLAKLVN